mmetsp:Transcript_31321/g.103673  ORF Transcript_31321/g.103673 Transcript_31321/m.103673 type:complete len:261 (+) Transcript_31321:208-990(+)
MGCSTLSPMQSAPTPILPCARLAALSEGYAARSITATTASRIDTASTASSACSRCDGGGGGHARSPARTASFAAAASPSAPRVRKWKTASSAACVVSGWRNVPADSAISSCGAAWSVEPSGSSEATKLRPTAARTSAGAAPCHRPAGSSNACGAAAAKRDSSGRIIAAAGPASASASVGTRSDSSAAWSPAQPLVGSHTMPSVRARAETRRRTDTAALRREAATGPPYEWATTSTRAAAAGSTVDRQSCARCACGQPSPP